MGFTQRASCRPYKNCFRSTRKLRGGVKVIPGLFDKYKRPFKKTVKNNKPSPLMTIKTVKNTLHLKSRVLELTTVDQDPNDFLPKAIDLIKTLLKVAKKTSLGSDTKKVDNFIIVLVNAIYQTFRRENNVNYDSNSTNVLSEDDIYNDPYNLLKALTVKLTALLESDNEDLKLETAEAIKTALHYGYNKVYVEEKDVEVDELSDMFARM